MEEGARCAQESDVGHSEAESEADSDADTVKPKGFMATIFPVLFAVLIFVCVISTDTNPDGHAKPINEAINATRDMLFDWGDTDDDQTITHSEFGKIAGATIVLLIFVCFWLYAEWSSQPGALDYENAAQILAKCFGDAATKKTDEEIKKQSKALIARRPIGVIRKLRAKNNWSTLRTKRGEYDKHRRDAAKRKLQWKNEARGKLYKNATPGEIEERKKLRLLFNKLDKKNEDGSKDGKITKEELMEAVKDEALAKDLCKVLKISGTAESSGQEVEVLKHCASVITNFFSYADFNEDGGIDFKEFVVGVLAADEQIAEDAEWELRQLYDVIDEDGTYFIECSQIIDRMLASNNRMLVFCRKREAYVG
jgi:hypothetical protein